MSPIVTADDWKAYINRGPWLLVAWGIAYLFIFPFPNYIYQHWDYICSLFPSSVYMFVFGSWFMNVGLTIVGNLVFSLIYASNLPFFEQYKTNKDQPWPWRSPQENVKQNFWSMLPYSILRVITNNLMVIPILFLLYPRAHALGLYSMDKEKFPDTFTLIWQLIICCIVEDTMFYWSHRTLHNPRIYKYIHKIHHEYYHPITLSSEHAHPIEFLVGNLLPVMMGPTILKSHIITLWLWILIRITVSIDEHCGYTFPWSPVRLIPFGATVDGHDFHHNQNKDAIFASQFTWWDALLGTDKGFHEWRNNHFHNNNNSNSQDIKKNFIVQEGENDKGESDEPVNVKRTSRSSSKKRN